MKLFLYMAIALTAYACIPSQNTENAGSSSALTSIKISGGKLPAGYKMSGAFNLNVEATDGNWIKESNGLMTKTLNASLSDGTSQNVSVTKNKSYKFILTGLIAQDNSTVVKRVKTCDASAVPVLVSQDNQVVSINLCDETNAIVSTPDASVTNVSIEPTYTPGTVNAAIVAGGGSRTATSNTCKCLEMNDIVSLKNDYIFRFSAIRDLGDANLTATFINAENIIDPKLVNLSTNFKNSGNAAYWAQTCFNTMEQLRTEIQNLKNQVKNTSQMSEAAKQIAAKASAEFEGSLNEAINKMTCR